MNVNKYKANRYRIVTDKVKCRRVNLAKSTRVVLAFSCIATHLLTYDYIT